MIHYQVSIERPQEHFIQFSMKWEVGEKNEVLLQLPVWRPGRYELGYFAKNIRRFSVVDSDNKKVKVEKVGHSQWLVDTQKANTITVSYEYFANELNAGSTYLDKEQLYINPVNCFFYLPEALEEAYTIQFRLPKNYKIACSLKKKSTHTLMAKNHWELMDSPLIASNNWQKKIYAIDKYKFHILFQGVVKPDWDMILRDFTKFTKKQIQCFGNFPVKEYWFLVQMPSRNAYHGVEHERSTVIALGPGYNLMTEGLYDNFLGICSHELYHTWNVKNIKPRAFSPYDFSKENYNRIGYIIEGITTYMGDKMLWAAGVRNDRWFKNKLATHFQRHMWNDGRHNHSVRDSSFDTWLDGYVAGIPGRKVSIYTEGALLAFILDTELKIQSKGKKNLDTVMKFFYEKYGSSMEGYTENDFWNIVQDVNGGSLRSLYRNYYDNAISYERKFKGAVKKMGWKIQEDHSNLLQSNFGLLVGDAKTNAIVKVHPESKAAKNNIAIGDKIVAINDQVIDDNLQDWIRFYQKDDSMMFLLESNGKFTSVRLNRSKSLYCQYTIE